MLVSRLSRIGAGIGRQLSRGISTSLCRRGYVQKPYSQYWQPQFKLHPETKQFQHTFFWKQHLFSTTSSGSANGDAKEKKDAISVTFVDKDGEEKHIKDMDYYNKLEDPTDEENDMLDLAFVLTETSCSGCQVIISSCCNMELCCRWATLSTMHKWTEGILRP